MRRVPVGYWVTAGLVVILILAFIIFQLGSGVPQAAVDACLAEVTGRLALTESATFDVTASAGNVAGDVADGPVRASFHCAIEGDRVVSVTVAD